MKGHILRLFQVGFNPFCLRACYRNSKRERRWVEMKGEMIQIKIWLVKGRLQVPNGFFDPQCHLFRVSGG